MSLKEKIKTVCSRLASKKIDFKEWKNNLKSIWESFTDILKHKHRFVVMDSETFREKFSFQLSGINVFVTVGVSVIVLVVLTSLLIAFTPLREFIPGYQNGAMVEQTYRNAQTIDSLEHELNNMEWMVEAMRDVISGKAMPGEAEAQQLVDSLSTMGISLEEYRHSRDDSLLRAEIEQEQQAEEDRQHKVADKSKNNKKSSKRSKRRR